MICGVGFYPNIAFAAFKRTFFAINLSKCVKKISEK
jgi:hypothetical protein